MQQKINLTQVICLRMGKTIEEKTPPGEFKVTTPENLLLSKQAVTSKGILVPYTNLQLNPYPNTHWTCSVVTISPFQCTAPNTWLTNCADPSMRFDHQLEKDVGCKVLQFIQMMKIMKLLGHKTLWCTNTTTSSRKRWIMANFVSGHNLLEQTLLNTYATCEHFDSP